MLRQNERRKFDADVRYNHIRKDRRPKNAASECAIRCSTWCYDFFEFINCSSFPQSCTIHVYFIWHHEKEIGKKNASAIKVSMYNCFLSLSVLPSTADVSYDCSRTPFSNARFLISRHTAYRVRDFWIFYTRTREGTTTAEVKINFLYFPPFFPHVELR